MAIITDPAFLFILMMSEHFTGSAVPSAEDGESPGSSVVVPFAARGFLEHDDALMAQEGTEAGRGGEPARNHLSEGRKEPKMRLLICMISRSLLCLLYLLQMNASIRANTASRSTHVVRIMVMDVLPVERAEIGNAALILPASSHCLRSQLSWPLIHLVLYIPLHPGAGDP